LFIIKLLPLLRGWGYTSYDGAFYSDIALHVYKGEWLLTSNSSFDQFYKILPRPTHVYPSWPLLGGLLAHLLPDSLKSSCKVSAMPFTAVLVTLNAPL